MGRPSLALPLLFRCKLFATGTLQIGEVSLGEFPHDGSGNMFVVVSEYIADACHLFGNV
jgi:hypothetical protein